jgi:leucyl aminopeptidase (aminopeptidase T)
MIDGFLWPPDALGRLEAPIRLAIDNGLVSAIDGGDAAVLDKWLDGKSRQIFHFLIGLHPRATLMGRILEAERSYGCVSIGFGVYPFHTDGVMTQPTIVLDDDVVFIEQGRFVHPELAEIDRQLVAPQD